MTMKIPLTREAILALDAEEFSALDKKMLLQRFFPAQPLPEWKRKLRKDWSDARRWAAYAGTDTIGATGNPYRYKNDYLQHTARARPPKRMGNRVSDFTNWIYSLYLGRVVPESLEDGKRVERQVAARLGRAPESTDWEPIYEDPLDHPPEPLRISALVVNDQPLWGAPDLVFRNRKTGAITIVERKASNRDVPSDGWPNLRAQLWAYAHIDKWVDAQSITLVGEVWGFQGEKVFLRKVLRWDHNTPDVYAPNALLFGLYGGAVGNPAKLR